MTMCQCECSIEVLCWYMSFMSNKWSFAMACFVCSKHDLFFLPIEMVTLMYSMATCACMVALYSDTKIVERE